jgi:hypothetical protein
MKRDCKGPEGREAHDCRDESEHAPGPIRETPDQHPERDLPHVDRRPWPHPWLHAPEAVHSRRIHGPVERLEEFGRPAVEQDAKPDFLVCRNRLYEEVPRQVEDCHVGTEDHQPVHPTRAPCENGTQPTRHSTSSPATDENGTARYHSDRCSRPTRHDGEPLRRPPTRSRDLGGVRDGERVTDAGPVRTGGVAGYTLASSLPTFPRSRAARRATRLRLYQTGPNRKSHEA